MTTEEVIDLLSTVAAFDRRTVGEADVIAWSAAVGDLNFGDAREVVVQHYRTSRDWLMPSDIRTGVKKIRDARLAKAPMPAPDPALTDRPKDYQEAFQAALERFADGFAPPKMIRARVEPSQAYTELRGPDRNPLRVASLLVACPWPACQAPPGFVCVDADGNRLSVPAHDARLQAAGLTGEPGAIGGPS